MNSGSKEEKNYMWVEKENESEISLRDYLHIILKRKWLIFLTIIVMSAVSSFIIEMREPIYRTSGSLLINRMSVPGTSGSSKVLQIPMDSFTPRFKSMEMIEKVMQKLKVKKELFHEIRSSLSINANPQNSTVELSMKGKDPRFISAVINEVMDEFIVVLDNENSSDNNSESQALYEKLQLFEKNYNEALKKFKQYQSVNSVYSFPDEMGDYKKRLTDKQQEKFALETQLENLKISLKTNEEEIKNYLKSTGKSENELNSFAVESAQVKILQKELQKVENELEKQKKIYKPNHPKLLDLEGDIEKIEEQIQTEMGISKSNDPIYENLLKNMMSMRERISQITIDLSTITEVISHYETKFREASSKNFEYYQYSRDVELAENIYKRLLENYSEAKVTRGILKAEGKITSRAPVPAKPVYPNKPMMYIATLFVSIFSSIVLAFLIEHLDETVKNHDQLESEIGLPVMGMIPKFRKLIVDGFSDHLPFDPTLVTYYNIQSPESEAFKTLRLKMKFYNKGQYPQKILITSSAQGNGKSLVSANLAVTFAQSQKKVLLCDCDLRKPFQYVMFNRDNAVGIGDMFLENTIENKIIHSDIPNLDLLLSGTMVPNPLEIFDSERFEEIVEQLALQYDIIIFDTPPVPIPDALAIIPHVDCALFVGSIRNDKLRMIKHGIKSVMEIHPKMVGMICNHVSDRELGGYYYRYGQF